MGHGGMHMLLGLVRRDAEGWGRGCRSMISCVVVTGKVAYFRIMIKGNIYSF